MNSCTGEKTGSHILPVKYNDFLEKNEMAKQQQTKTKGLSRPKPNPDKPIPADAPDKNDPQVMSDPRLAAIPRDMTDEGVSPSDAGENVKGVWRVQLMSVPTLTQNPAEVEAFSETEAWKEFCRINNISGSDHDKKIERIGDVITGTAGVADATTGDNHRTGGDQQ